MVGRGLLGRETRAREDIGEWSRTKGESETEKDEEEWQPVNEENVKKIRV